tara:strand:+ start:87 stop:392 length:306 start_codon:yes stop_codon:yes gene_type:complete
MLTGTALSVAAVAVNVMVYVAAIQATLNTAVIVVGVAAYGSYWAEVGAEDAIVTPGNTTEITSPISILLTVENVTLTFTALPSVDALNEREDDSKAPTVVV